MCYYLNRFLNFKQLSLSERSHKRHLCKNNWLGYNFQREYSADFYLHNAKYVTGRAFAAAAIQWIEVHRNNQAKLTVKSVTLPTTALQHPQYKHVNQQQQDVQQNNNDS